MLSNKVTAQDKRVRLGHPGKPCATGVYRQRCGRDRLAMNFRTRRRTDRGTGRSYSEIYNALRPYRSTKVRAVAIADDPRKPLSGKDLRSFRS
ncbi:hypothetical protein KCP76_25775 [Salmonella enterica subsp. enterica serovar Weltevreden]|nr:hypothetical protein KCP76_25775 [Salmonella enterica subsp. enterica serovar Weltevreden]